MEEGLRQDATDGPSPIMWTGSSVVGVDFLRNREPGQDAKIGLQPACFRADRLRDIVSSFGLALITKFIHAVPRPSGMLGTDR